MENTINSQRTRKSLQQHFRELWLQRDLQVMILPWMLLVIVFSYIPMYGLIIAFQDLRLGDVMGFSRWVGFEHFRMFFTSPDFWPIMRNTFAISFLKMIFVFPTPILLALMLNEVRGIKYKRAVQTISYLPYFISWVVVAGLALDFMRTDGAINSILLSFGIIDSPISFMNNPDYFWTIIVITDIWKNVGWSAIIYIAAIASINPELYQAAEIDGAGRFAKIWHITMAGIKPTVVILLILTTGSIIQSSFDQVMLLTNNLQNTMVFERSEILDTHIFRVGMRNMRYSYATAVGLFRSFISVSLLLSANYIARKLSDESLF